MTDLLPLSDEDLAFLTPYLPPTDPTQAPSTSASSPNPNSSPSTTPTSNRPPRPFVTLTYATSLDGLLSHSPGVRTTLSGPATKSLTHYLRAHHDAILVGAGTAVADDPALSCRYPGVGAEAQPRPVVVDVRGRWGPGGSQAVEAGRARGTGGAVWVIKAGEAGGGGEGWEGLGVGEAGADGRVSWEAILARLAAGGVRSVMIEGGGRVIAELLARPELVDVVIVTVAPTWLGVGGVGIAPEQRFEGGQRVNAARLAGTAWRQFGEDAVLCGTPLK